MTDGVRAMADRSLVASEPMTRIDLSIGAPVVAEKRRGILLPAVR